MGSLSSSVISLGATSLTAGRVCLVCSVLVFFKYTYLNAYILRGLRKLNTTIIAVVHMSNVDSASNRNEYQEYFLGERRPVRRADKLTVFMCRLS